MFNYALPYDAVVSNHLVEDISIWIKNSLRSFLDRYYGLYFDYSTYAYNTDDIFIWGHMSNEVIQLGLVIIDYFLICWGYGPHRDYWKEIWKLNTLRSSYSLVEWAMRFFQQLEVPLLLCLMTLGVRDMVIRESILYMESVIVLYSKRCWFWLVLTITYWVLVFRKLIYWLHFPMRKLNKEAFTSLLVVLWKIKKQGTWRSFKKRLCTTWFFDSCSYSPKELQDA